MSENTTSQEPSSWLEKLQVESWQAELIISGIAIFGVFQIEKLVFDSFSWMIFYLPPNLENFQYFSVVYLSMAFGGLQVFFVVHFILRAFWVAVLGVASVYPHGIRADEEHEMFSAHYLKAWKADFPDLQGYVERLDKICSTQLSGAFVLAMVGVSFAFWIVISGLIYHLLSGRVPENVLFWLGIGAIGLVVFFALFSMVFGATSLKNSEFAKRYHYPINRSFSKMMYMVFYRPFSYIVGATQTNSDTKKVAAQAFLIPVLLSLVISIKLVPAIKSLPINQDRYFQLDTESNTLRTRNYADQYPDHQYVLSPILPSANWHQNQYLEFFVPLLTRERDPLLDECSEPEVPEEVEGIRRFKVHERRLVCYKSGFEFRINGRVVDPTVKFHAYALNSERGMWCYIANPPIQEGENILSITHYWRNEDGERKVDNIPFFYQPWEGEQ